MSNFKVASWNVNSLRVRLPHVLDWLDSEKPDVLGLQELKLTDEQFPVEEIREAGYHASFAGQKTYNGVALITKSPAQDIIKAMPRLDDPQKRVIAGTVPYSLSKTESKNQDLIRVINLYVPNGQEIGSDKYDYKLTWLSKLADFLAKEMSQYPNIIVMGDFNIAPGDSDVYDPEAWQEHILCSTPERQALKRLLDLGLNDTFRLFEQEPELYSWWDYRAAGFRRNRGLRIDLVLSSESLSNQCKAAYIDKAPRKLERPSDHAPAVSEFACAN